MIGIEKPSITATEMNESGSFGTFVLEPLERGKLRATKEKEEALQLYPSVQKALDKLAKTNIIHKNKASNLKSKLALYINKLS
mgnify:CR=1 FL=1